MLQQALQEALVVLDHQLLSDKLSRGEAIAEAIGSTLTGCLAVEIAREPEGLYAAWRADARPVGTTGNGGRHDHAL